MQAPALRRDLAAGCAIFLAVAPPGARAQEQSRDQPQAPDAFLALNAARPGAFNYARLSDIQVFLDASPTRCAVLLTDGQEIKAFQKCETITRHLEHVGFVLLPNAFGSVMLAPGFVSSLVATSDGGCRLNLRNGKWAQVTRPCSSVHDAIGAR
ncbi:hypothetical protein Msil_1139 [Methylocella silvestris BL2]|uniref:Uncharacterized protein n=1 Tax=Methylocella silvestris (strain DSM 15510 / CIP 108128 / LMG 27833 / NCIMB 13906 / BL2) TaxID=395965 RepID=B8ENH7_METSB|nr:hypothetical protein [Methylocella silvestris]ACK50108.1 hypothetical protein Msil_1139 [Methylocella silvestris BL2]